MHKHEIYLKRCFELAKQGETHTFPNPIVGCLIVHRDRIIGEGFHQRCGEAHAEVNAINNTRSEDQELFTDSTIYVSLEPCAHHGRTPPCADLIIKHKFKRLVFSSYDPNPLVSGQGIQRIRAAGIEVIESQDLDPELIKESNWLNRVFFKQIHSKANTNNTWITLKIAATADGSMLSSEKWITNSRSREDVHRLRSTHQLLVTTIATVRADDPLYTVRHTPEELKLADIHNPDVVILKSDSDFTDIERKTLNIFPNNDRKLFEYQSNKNDLSSLSNFISHMQELGYQKIMVEAGPTLSEAFINSGLVDEIIYYLVADNILSEHNAPFLNKEFKLSKSELMTSTEETTNIKLVYSKSGS